MFKKIWRPALLVLAAGQGRRSYNANFKATRWGIGVAILLLGIYFGVLALISGWNFTINQFQQFWYYIVALATGFGIQVGLYVFLRNLILSGNGYGKVLAVSGATSTVAMISCCAHYLANILPVLAISGAVSIVTQYQIQLFWVGLAFNAGGIVFVARKVIAFRRGGGATPNATNLP